MKLFLIFAVTLPLAAFMALPSSPTEVKSSNCNFDEASAQSTAKSVANLAIRLYQIISKQQENVVFSPVSIALGLALLESGASGDTKSEIHSLLNPNGTNSSASIASFQSLQHQLQNRDDEKAKLSIANGLFYSERVHLKTDYVNQLKECFETEIAQQPFASDLETARININKWISDATNNKIPELFKPGVLDPNALAVLANAVYMKAFWVNRFYNTKDLSFYRNGKLDQVQTTKFMLQQEHYGYQSTDAVHVVELPYMNLPLSMFIILPKQRDGIEALEKSLTADQLLSLVAPSPYTDVILKLPKFTVRQSVDLKDALEQLGLQNIFTNQANFSQMAVEPLKVSKAKHEAFIKINENGTEAAAVSAFEMMAGAAGPSREEPVEFTVDHPFLYAIVHRQTSAVVFLGKVSRVEEN